ncbi:hypothetical protein KIN20_007275 [Parelaphostrongylus tenuis]|uniref:Uncharacterized protein n=1 Tax=Parelaphostrongylus tenuis TaxID=148309 RepID=A0AAD5MPD5_PARTN|nr:hypothetical protein KIN20_007275 [Parelaphostrongylus tenuis]
MRQSRIDDEKEERSKALKDAKFYTVMSYCASKEVKIMATFYEAICEVNERSIFDTCPLVLHDHLDPQLLKFHHPGYNPKANCIVYEPLTDLVGAQVQVNEKGKGYKCKARCIFPDGDRRYIVDEWIMLPSTKIFECDVVETMCLKNSTAESFLHSQIYEQKNAQKISKPDVYLFIIDSASSFMVKRSLPKTLAYLKSMGGVQMEFLNKVGENSKPNGFPLVFGKMMFKLLLDLNIRVI